MTDKEKIVLLGFEEYPPCPIRFVEPSQDKHWLAEEQVRRRHSRSERRLNEVARVAREWEDYERAKIGLEVLNRCLCEMIIEKFKRKYGQEPECDLSPYLFRPEKLLRADWKFYSNGGKSESEFRDAWRWDGKEWVCMKNAPAL